MLSIGGCTVLMLKFKTKEAIKILKKGYATCIIGVPALFNALLSRDAFYGPWLQRQNTAFVGGDAVPESLLTRWNSAMAKWGSSARLFQGYGLSETCAVSNVNYRGHAKVNTVGLPLPGLKEKIIDTETLQELKANQAGEICIAGNSIMDRRLEGVAFPAVLRIRNHFKEILFLDLGEYRLVFGTRAIIDHDQAGEVAGFKMRKERQDFLAWLINGDEQCLFHSPY